ncbi:hypothetical protein DPMN_115349 [Dreissena polymorpha]|uniref:Uncharacterized protein n=1 Tax=Dreissena polymorpha TaxID=45954 RepID=A0A9D4KL37_DREPO|nr:hypothetical protein DPMN_115349 [Dreissena polymorpha]
MKTFSDVIHTNGKMYVTNICISMTTRSYVHFASQIMYSAGELPSIYTPADDYKAEHQEREKPGADYLGDCHALCDPDHV